MKEETKVDTKQRKIPGGMKLIFFVFAALVVMKAVDYAGTSPEMKSGEVIQRGQTLLGEGLEKGKEIFRDLKKDGEEKGESFSSSSFSYSEISPETPFNYLIGEDVGEKWAKIATVFFYISALFLVLIVARRILNIFSKERVWRLTSLEVGMMYVIILTGIAFLTLPYLDKKGLLEEYSKSKPEKVRTMEENRLGNDAKMEKSILTEVPMLERIMEGGIAFELPNPEFAAPGMEYNVCLEITSPSNWKKTGRFPIRQFTLERVNVYWVRAKPSKELVEFIKLYKLEKNPFVVEVRLLQLQKGKPKEVKIWCPTVSASDT